MLYSKYNTPKRSLSLSSSSHGACAKIGPQLYLLYTHTHMDMYVTSILARHRISKANSSCINKLEQDQVLKTFSSTIHKPIIHTLSIHLETIIIQIHLYRQNTLFEKSFLHFKIISHHTLPAKPFIRINHSSWLTKDR